MYRHFKVSQSGSQAYHWNLGVEPSHPFELSGKCFNRIISPLAEISLAEMSSVLKSDVGRRKEVILGMQTIQRKRSRTKWATAAKYLRRSESSTEKSISKQKGDLGREGRK